MDDLEKRRKVLFEELEKINAKITEAELQKQNDLKEKRCVKVVCDTCYGLGETEDRLASTDEPIAAACYDCGGHGWKYEIPFTGIRDYEETFDKLFTGR